jgi:hypothetical protein
MPSEQGHRLYVKYVHTKISPSRGGISKSRITDIAQPCDGTMEGPYSTAQERAWTESMNANMLFLQGQAHLVPAREALDQAQHLPHQD